MSYEYETQTANTQIRRAAVLAKYSLSILEMFIVAPPPNTCRKERTGYSTWISISSYHGNGQPHDCVTALRRNRGWSIPVDVAARNELLHMCTR